MPKRPFYCAIFQVGILPILLLGFWTLSAQKRIALLVGIGQYQDGNWSKLNGDKDVNFMDSTLRNYEFFSISNLKNNQATQQGILTGLKNLESKAQTGDIVLFHFSGHGQLIADQNRDEVDGYDEAIVPWDSPLGAQFSNDPRRLIRDDDLASLFLAIRKKIGPKGTLICVLDACYSAELLRNENNIVVRGAPFIAAAQNYQQEMKKGETSHPIDTSSIEHALHESLGHYVAFSACLANEKNYEYHDKQMGSLTYAFCTALNTSLNADTYQILYEKIRREINRIVAGQTPMLEGAKNQVIFSTNRSFVFHYSINKVLDPEMVRINGGRNWGLGLGDIIEFRQPGVGARPKVVTGTITKISGIEAEIKLAAPMHNREGLESLWGYLSFSSPTSPQLKVKCLPTQDAELTLLYEPLKNNPELQLNSVNPDLILGIYPENPNQIELRSNLGKTLFLIPKNSLHPAQLSDTLYKSVLAYKLGQFYKGLRAHSINTNGVIEFIELNVNGVSQALSSRRDHTKGWSFRPKDIVKYRLRNTGNTPAYFYVLNILDNGMGKPIFPYFEKDFSKYYLQPGGTCEGRFMVDVHPGKELMILLVSLTPLKDLETFFFDIRRRGQTDLEVIPDLSTQGIDFIIEKK